MADLNDYKNKIKTMFLQNRDLQRLIYYNSLSPLTENYLKNPYLLFEQPNNPNPIEQPRIYFKYKDPNLITDKTCILLINFIEYPIGGSLAFNKVSVIFTILCSNGIVELTNGEDRLFSIANMIDDYMNGNKHLGFKKAKNGGRRSLTVNGNLTGMNVIYEVVDRSFNYHNESGD